MLSFSNTIDEPFTDDALQNTPLTHKQREALIAKLPKDPIDDYHYFGNLYPKKYSGWKLHIAGATIVDSVNLYKKLSSVTTHWQAAAKVGGLSAMNGVYHSDSLYDPSDFEYGKSGATIYIPPKVFAKDKSEKFVRDIQLALLDYNCLIEVKGNKQLSYTPNISYRYELSKPIDIKQGIDRASYEELYQPAETSNYKPDKVIDPFLHLIL